MTPADALTRTPFDCGLNLFTLLVEQEIERVEAAGAQAMQLATYPGGRPADAAAKAIHAMTQEKIARLRALLAQYRSWWQAHYEER